MSEYFIEKKVEVSEFDELGKCVSYRPQTWAIRVIDAGGRRIQLFAAAGCAGVTLFNGPDEAKRALARLGVERPFCELERFSGGRRRETVTTFEAVQLRPAADDFNDGEPAVMTAIRGTAPREHAAGRAPGDDRRASMVSCEYRDERHGSSPGRRR